MSTAQRSIFRSEAIRHYAQGHGKSVLPRFARPRAFISLWVILGLLIMAAGYVTLSARERMAGVDTSPVRGHIEP
jgi:hypothetical protein